MKFLHIADVHLGCTRYQLVESPRDFYDAWVDVLERYAVGEKVDFVLIAGDFFHKKAVPPETMNYAVDGLTMMRDAGIPVIAIEGNHDQKHTDSEFSWLRSLAKWGLLTLLEPLSQNGTFSYWPWDEAKKAGGYIDIGQARIFGSDWYGASGNWAIPRLIEAISADRREGAFHILLLHTDVEGHQTHPIPALSQDALKQLKSVVDYVALGHTHKHYEIDNWAFNPGSIEITNIAEFRETRGAFVVEVDDKGNVAARHFDEYHARPFQRLSFDVSNSADPKEVTAGVLERVQLECRIAEPGHPKPIVEITLRGRLGFPNSTLELQKVRDEAMTMTDALHVRIKNQTIPAEYIETSVELDDSARDLLERRVIDDLVIRDDRFKARHENVSNAIVGAKRMALGDEPAEKIADFIAQTALARPEQIGG
ncbi:MAG: exonuclease SbcCD subunit D [Acidobacteria bacterium]|nr:exonuclease SbcCD subunit D [Acidobacteriota bacterium]